LYTQKGLKGSLAALGTAAVLGIYSAGYSLTEEAAQRLEEPFGGYSTPPLMPQVMIEGVTEPLPVPEVALAPEVASAPLSPEIVSRPEKLPGEVVPAPSTPAPAAAVASSTELPASTPQPASPPAMPTPAAAVAENPAPPTTTPAGDSVADEARAESLYRDGTYTSWGMRTRHGQIEARVEISGGMIVSATVQSCGMRWPCSDLNRILPRVVERQSTAIGIVSGATQTSQAFITAVDAALMQAMNTTP